MNDLIDTKIVKYEFKLPIRRSASDIWSIMIDRIDDWWMSDFRALGEGSHVTLSALVGGQLILSLIHI